MAQEFKIGRLRFTWRGQWDNNVTYNRDAVVQYEGKCYVCKYPHTSSATDFYEDLYYIAPGGADESRWTIMLDGRAWKQDWTPNTAYSLGNIVRYGGVVYVCTEAHTSDPDAIDQTKWDVYSRFDNWTSAWATSTFYGENDIVKYGGIVYRCVEDHESTTTVSLGLEADQAKWEVVNDGLEYRGEWTATTRYKKNDIVKSGADAYKCTQGHTSTSTFDDTKFSLWLPGEEYYGTWSSSAVYQEGDIIIYGGYSYMSIIPNNTNIIPSTNAEDSSSAWELVTKGFNTRNEWASGPYKVGDIVRRAGQLFAAIADSTSEDPTAFSVSTTYTATGSSGTTVKVASSSGVVPGMIIHGSGFTLGQTVVSVQNSTTVVLDRAPDGTPTDSQILNFVGVNYTYWKLVIPGINWNNFWEAETLYVIGETVIWQNATYRCIQTIPNTTSAIRPDLDTSSSYWTLLAAHDRFNAGNTQGDIVTRSADEVNVAVPIGTQDYVLRATDGTPQWRKIQVVPDVYYVAPEGVDSADRGDTIDKPWASIKYACERIAQGSLNQNANTLLVENKEWLVEEMYQWMLYQKQESNSPFNPASEFDEFSTRRDARLIIDALSYDITRGSNSRIVYATQSYFADNSDTSFYNEETDAAQAFIVASLEFLTTLIGNALNQTTPADSYQELMSVPEIDRLSQYKNAGISTELNAYVEIQSLMDLVINAIDVANKKTLPLPNDGITSTVMVKTGTYSEQLPIIVPDNTAINGDELRGAVVQPATRIVTFATNVYESTNEIGVYSVAGMEVDMPIQMKAPTTNDQFSNITEAQTYYIASIDEVTNRITISETVGGADFDIDADDSGFMDVYAGECLKDMFYVRNATGIRNMTLTGLAGFLGPINSFGTRRPTGGAYVSLDPGTGPDDTTTWILRRSPYIQNVTNFGTGCVGMKIDGYLHNGGNKSIVCNDFTQILSDGIGVWCVGPDSLTECVSVFAYYNYAGYFAEDGGRIRATNGNSSYGSYGVIAEGFDATEIPITGKIDNRSTQVQADVQSAFGTSAELLSMQYNNAGSGYFESTTNMLLHSNNFIESAWVTDGNVLIQQNNTAPNDQTTAWTFTGTTSSSDSSYIYQNVSIPVAGEEYTALSSLNVTGSGSSATFDITVGATSYSAVVNDGGSGYVVGNQLRILGSQLGGVDGTNDCFLEVQSLSGSSILTVTVTGTVPQGSAQEYTLSIYARQGTSTSFDMSAIFSGSSTCTANANFNFENETFTTFVTGATGTVTTGKLELPSGWWRLWITVYDYNALNNQVQFRIYPRGRSGNAGFTRYYGAQVQIASSPTFYLETNSNKFSSYADYFVTGAGTGAELIGDELRSGAVFQTRITDEGTGTGGRGYLVASNNAQGGNDEYVILAGSNTNTENQLVGMRVFLQSGTGAGQYGYISAFDDAVTKTAQVLKESFEPLVITATDNGTSEFTISGGTTDHLYVDQLVQFIPTYYTTEVTQTSTEELDVSATLGGTDNKITVLSTAKLEANMTVKFTGSIFGGLTDEYTYYIKEVVNSTQFSITTEPFGNVQQLVDAFASPTQIMKVIFPSYTSYINANTSNMLVNMPISFTGTSMGDIDVGTTYYVNDVIDGSTFTISSTLVELNATATQASTNYITTSGTSNLVSMNPILFSGTTIGGLVAGTKYYINKIINSTQFTITDTIIETTAYETAEITNLITVDSTAGFIANNPIKFVGNTFGGIVNNTIYYILAINDATTFTISTTPGGSAVILSAGAGEVSVQTTDVPFTLTTASGTVALATTNTRTSLNFGQGSMIGTFQTKLFGNVVKGTTYYIKDIVDSTHFTVTATLGGSTAVTLKTDTGSMNVGAVGWDHINPGTPIESTLDNSTVYYVEPRVKYSDPTFTQSSTTLPTQSIGTTWSAIGYGDGTFIAIPSNYATAARSTDGETWTSVTLPETTNWADIAYGNNYWVAISEEVALDSTPNTVAYSNSNGLGWRTSTLPSSSAWKKVVYGNSKFVAISGSSSYTFKELSGTNVSGTGVGATFNVSVINGNYTVTLVNTGSGYSVSNQIKILGTALGGTSPTNDLTITVATLTSTALPPASTTGIETVTTSGTGVNASASAYSTNYGSAWTAGTGLPSANYTGLTYGQGRFVAVSNGGSYSALSATNVTATGSGAKFNVTKTGSTYTVSVANGGTGYSAGQTLKILGTSLGGSTTANDLSITIDTMQSGLGADPTAIATVTFTGTAVSNTAAYSDDGITWTATTLPTTSTWSDVTFGSGLFVAVSSDDAKPIYSRDGITWYESLITLTPMAKVQYGQGVFVAVDDTSGTAWTSEEGINWKERIVSDDGYTALAFGFTDTDGAGVFVTAAGQSTGSIISAGCRTKGRVNVASGRITSVTLWEPGSGYDSVPTTTFTDPNITLSVTYLNRISNGTLGNPSFYNRGQDYNTNSTQITINGGGYADTFQTGLTIIVKDLTSLPGPGDNLVIDGVDQVYKVTNAEVVFGTVAPNIQANIQISPEMSVANSPAHEADVTIRVKYSQARLTGHDFLNVGYGNAIQSNYPDVPEDTVLAPQDQAVEVNFGRVFYTSTDQDGNFRVGNLFAVEQATGIVTLSASQFGLSGLETLSLGGIAVGTASVVIRQFSTDDTFIANSNEIIPTQRAIKSYLTNRLSQGGSNTFTGQLIAGTVLVGGPNKISSTIPAGLEGSVVNMPTIVRFQGEFAGWDGDGMALQYFIKSWNRR